MPAFITLRNINIRKNWICSAKQVFHYSHFIKLYQVIVICWLVKNLATKLSFHKDTCPFFNIYITWWEKWGWMTTNININRNFAWISYKKKNHNTNSILFGFNILSYILDAINWKLWWKKEYFKVNRKNISNVENVMNT